MFALLMTLVLPLTAATVPPSMRLFDAPVRLLAQLDAPPPMPEASPTPMGDLEMRINSLNNQIRLTQMGWPGGSIAMTVVGFVVSSMLLPAMFVWLFAGIAGGSSLVGVAAALTVIGVVGLAVAIAGIITGVSSQANAKTHRDELVLEREQLERQLRAARTGDYSVERLSPAPALITLAQF